MESCSSAQASGSLCQPEPQRQVGVDVNPTRNEPTDTSFFLRLSGQVSSPLLQRRRRQRCPNRPTVDNVAKGVPVDIPICDADAHLEQLILRRQYECLVHCQKQDHGCEGEALVAIDEWVIGVQVVLQHSSLALQRSMVWLARLVHCAGQQRNGHPNRE